MGEVFERIIIKSVKPCLRKIIGQAKFSHDELLTMITEVEMVLNSRPLSYFSTNDIEEPLTPSHLLIGQTLMSLPDYLHSCQGLKEFEATHDILTRQARYLNTTMEGKVEEGVFGGTEGIPSL